MSLFEENAEILRKIAAGGTDLGVPRSVDFAHVFPDQASADSFARAAKQEGFATRVYAPEEADESWDVIAAVEIVPSCETVTGTEAHLHALAQERGGEADGWGFMED